MTQPPNQTVRPPIQHPGEERVERHSSPLGRGRAALHCAPTRPAWPCSPRAPARYHWTPEGRKLADFTSGVLVANLGHNPTRWWQRVLGVPGPRHDCRPSGEFCSGRHAHRVQRRSRRSKSQASRAAARQPAKPARRRAAGASAVGGHRQRSHPEGALGRARSPRRAKTSSSPRATAFTARRASPAPSPAARRDPERDPRVRFISFPTDECDNVAAPPAAARSGALRSTSWTALAAEHRQPHLLPDHRALPGRRRLVSSAEGVPATARAVLPRARHRLHPRRGAGQLRPHRLAVRLHALRRRARHRRPRQGPGQRRAGRRRRRPGRSVRQHALRRRLGHLERLPAWAAPPCWPRSTSSKRPTCWPTPSNWPK